VLRSLDLGFDQLSAWVVGQLQAQLPEDLCFVVGVGILQDSRDVGELVHDGLDLGLGHAGPPGRGLARCECVGRLLGFGLGDPRGDGGRACSGVERGAVLG
jgi:hypothetical protein